MIPGLGLVRRSITAALCGAAFWAGMQFAEVRQASACLDSGGAYDSRGFCSAEVPLK